VFQPLAATARLMGVAASTADPNNRRFVSNLSPAALYDPDSGWFFAPDVRVFWIEGGKKYPVANAGQVAPSLPAGQTNPSRIIGEVSRAVLDAYTTGGTFSSLYPNGVPPNAIGNGGSLPPPPPPPVDNRPPPPLPSAPAPGGYPDAAPAAGGSAGMPTWSYWLLGGLAAAGAGYAGYRYYQSRA
jgi:hypothetical protein